MRQLLVQQIDPQACPTQGLSTFNKVICLAILLSTLLAIIETEPVLATNWPQLFWWANLAFLLLFSAELALRIYIAPYTQAHLAQSRWRFYVAVGRYWICWCCYAVIRRTAAAGDPATQGVPNSSPFQVDPL